MRINNHVATMSTLGDPVATVTVVKKFLFCMPERYVQIAMSIETLLDLKTMSLEELIGRLRAAESRYALGSGGTSSAAGGQLLLTEEEWEARRKQRQQGQSSGGGGSGGNGNNNRCRSKAQANDAPAQPQYDANGREQDGALLHALQGAPSRTQTEAAASQCCAGG